VGSHFYDWFGFNKSLFLLINQIHAPLLDQAMLLATWLGHPALYPFYIAAALLLTWRQPSMLPQKNVVVFALSYAITSALVVPIIKTVLDLPRPLTVLGEQSVIVLGNPEMQHSFPSGHAAFAVLMTASLAPGISLGGRLALVIFALLVCLSRISVGAHFPADVLGGAAISILVVSAVHYLIGTAAKHRASYGPDAP
jgi:undecaprenyl-diphosphatase